MLISVDFRKSMYGYAMDSRTRGERNLVIFEDKLINYHFGVASIFLQGR